MHTPPATRLHQQHVLIHNHQRSLNSIGLNYKHEDVTSEPLAAYFHSQRAFPNYLRAYYIGTGQTHRHYDSLEWLTLDTMKHTYTAIHMNVSNGK